jgi:hypothetical protein
MKTTPEKLWVVDNHRMPAGSSHQPADKRLVRAACAQPADKRADNPDDPRYEEGRPEVVYTHARQNPACDAHDQRLPNQSKQQDRDPADSNGSGDEERLQQEASHAQDYGEL